MSRPQRQRRICAMPEYTVFAPDHASGGAPVSLSLDEFETLRLMDYEGCTHEQCAAVMQISRTTVTEIYAAARHKLTCALVEGRALVIGGGSVSLCDRSADCALGVCGRGDAPFGESGGRGGE